MNSYASSRNEGLDLIRAIAIFLVLFSHGRHLLPDFENKILFANGGFFGVELFFVLSGFLIGGILIKTIDQYQTYSFALLKDFWIRRWFRTLPNYFLFLLLGITLFEWLFGAREFEYEYLFFLQNFISPHPHLMPEAWSLSVEEWFYVTLPLLFLSFSKIKINQKYWILLTIFSYIIFFTLLRFFEVTTNNPSWDEGIRKIVLFRLDAIGYGVLMAFLDYYHPKFIKKFNKLIFILGSIISAISLILLSHQLLSFQESIFNKIFLFTIASIGLALLLPWFKYSYRNTGKTQAIICHLSLVSYSMYLVHLSFVLPFLQTYMLKIAPWFVLYSMYWLITIVISTFVYYYFEKPIMDIRDRKTTNNRTPKKSLWHKFK